MVLNHNGRENKEFNKLRVKRVQPYHIKNMVEISKILNYCGKDMARKYGLNHWNNPMIKSLIIVYLCVLKNRIYLVLEKNKPVATYQIRVQGQEMFFEKLAVLPSSEGKGYGAYCMKLIEQQAIKLGLNKVKMEVYDKSKNAIGFYVHQGYKKVAENKTLKYTDIVMEKEL